MKSFFSKLREKPESTRRKILHISMVVCVFVVVVFWVSSLFLKSWDGIDLSFVDKIKKVIPASDLEKVEDIVEEEPKKDPTFAISDEIEGFSKEEKLE